LLKKLFEKDEVVQVGQVIAIISTGGATESVNPVSTAQVSENNTIKEAAPVAVVASSNGQDSQIAITKSGPSGRFYSPLVRSIAKEEGITMQQLETIDGSGDQNRVTKKDILNYIQTKGTTAQPKVTEEVAKPVVAQVETAAKVVQTPTVKQESPTIPLWEGDEIIEMDRMRKLIADHMVMSVQTSPHVTSYVEADVTNIVLWREKIKKEFLASEGENLTFTPIFIEAIVRAIKDFPMVNVSVSGNNIIKRKDINIGMATALPSGNLIVPVIKKADNFNLTGLTKQVNSLANKARNNKLSSDDIQGGTYTVTNVGTFGNVMGTPIINQPQVAIMALGAIRKVPAVIETPQGDAIAIRHKMFLSHSYDHRVVDGALGGQFVRRVADYLEQFDLNREI
jgi:2-oxoglutarate dehydrogenase E2 component (dihydrolipoamide succinyltransferase)